MNNKKFRKIMFGMIFISILLVLIIKLDIFNKDNIQGLLEDGIADGYLGIVIMTIMMVFFVPLTWFTLMGAIFLDFKGYVYIMISALVASIISFFVARVFRNDMMNLVNKMNNKKKKPLDLNSLSSQIEEYGINYLYFIRSVPMTPYGLINYVSGFSSIGLKEYILGSFIGIVPSETINIFLMKSAYNMRASFKNFLVMLVIKLIYTLFVIINHKRTRKYA